MSDDSRATDTVIVLASDQASLYHFLKERQDTPGRTLVILDRRAGERRTNGGDPARGERRRGDRRSQPPAAALALMSVLGFMILHRDGEEWRS